MAMKRCENGHYFESEKHTSCPSCGVANLHIQPTVAAGRTGAAVQSRSDLDIPTVARGQAKPAAVERDPGATVGVVRKKMGIDPVVGWLVCVEGAEKGRDYRIRSERNFVGRDPKMDICIGGDDAISRDNHAVISFNPKRNTYLLTPGEGRGIIYLNDEEVATPKELKAYDMIELGQTKLLFVAFCGEKFTWV
jgi:hypothetical protein